MWSARLKPAGPPGTRTEGIAMGWARVAPSRCLLSFVLLTTAVTVCVCVASCVLLLLAPQVPYSEVYCRDISYTLYPALILAVTAVLAGLSLVLGACGVSRDSRATLITYCIVLVVVIGGELIGSATVFSFTYVGKLESAMGHRLSDDVMAFGNKDNSSAHMYRINKLQSKYECCGVKGYADWNDTAWKQREAGTGQVAPESCCMAQFTTDHYNCSFNSSMIYHTGCVDVLLYRMDIAVDCMLGGCVLAALLNLVTILLGCRGVRIITRYQSYTVI